MNIQIDVDPEQAQRFLSARERVGLYLLGVMFLIIFPARYSHQMKELFATFSELKK